MSSIPALVKPSVLRWARTSIDLTPIAAARKIGVPDGRVEEWENGTTQPTIAQLKKAARIYRRALAIFFLPEPPADFDTLRDFRRLDNAESGVWSPELHSEYRRALSQREYTLEIAELEEVKPSEVWRLTNLPKNDEDIGYTARHLLLDMTPLPLPRQTGNFYDHLNTWVAALETVGVLVFSTARGKVSLEEMRGFSLYFDSVPVIVVNGVDSVRGRLFSLLHEYAHLILNTAGLCDTIADSRATSPNRRLEARCNAIAAAILMPRREVLAQPLVQAHATDQSGWNYDTLKTAATPFGVSAEALLRRLLTFGRINQSFYQARREEFLARYEQEEDKKKSGGGNWYRNTVRDLGKGYVRQVADAYSRRVIDSNAAATYLNAKVSQIPELAEKAALRTVV